MLQREGLKVPIYSISWQRQQPNMPEEEVISYKNQEAAENKLDVVRKWSISLNDAQHMLHKELEQCLNDVQHMLH